MKDYKIAVQPSHIGICGILTIIFITLKVLEIGKIAEWSWIWVLCPVWLPLILIISIVIFILCIGFLYTMLIHFFPKSKKNDKKIH